MFQTIIVQPLYNLLIILTNNLGGHLALGVLALTFLVRLILAPSSISALKSQLAQQKLKPEVDKIKKEITDQAEQGKALMELYKKNGANPLSGCLPILIQIPVILGLYRALIAAASGATTLLYPTILLSEHFSATLLSVNLLEKSLVIAILAGVTQFLQQYWSPIGKATEANATENDPAANMQKTMKYVLPVMIGFFAYAVPGAVALYWVISNIFTILLELYMEKKYTNK